MAALQPNGVKEGSLSYYEIHLKTSEGEMAPISRNVAKEIYCNGMSHHCTTETVD